MARKARVWTDSAVSVFSWWAVRRIIDAMTGILKASNTSLCSRLTGQDRSSNLQGNTGERHESHLTSGSFQ